MQWGVVGRAGVGWGVTGWGGGVRRLGVVWCYGVECYGVEYYRVGRWVLWVRYGFGWGWGRFGVEVGKNTLFPLRPPLFSNLPCASQIG